MTATEQAIKEAVEKPCEICSISIPRGTKLSSRQWARRKFCSFRCGGIALARRHLPPWNKGRDNPYAKGALSHLWRGGVTAINANFRKTFVYREWRRHVFQRDDYTCQSCGVRGGRLQADHELPFSLYPHLRLEILNGRTLCVPCHQKTDTFGEKLKSYAALK